MRLTAKQNNTLRAMLSWLAGIIMFFPIFWLVLTSFKTELQAISVPPLLFFEPTLENFILVQERSDYFTYAINSVATSFGATLLALLVAIPASYAMAFWPSRFTKDILLWMLSTKMLPAVGVLMPIYLLVQKAGLLDTRTALIIIFAMINLPIIIWMLFSYFKEVPREILESARMDGASTLDIITLLLIPLTRGGILSTALLSIVLCWNEAFWSINLTASDAGTLTALVASYSSPEGLFWAKLSAVSTLACAPIVVFGWFCQKQLVQGLTFGAVK
ncbi:MAG: carbohydrate ABC transporter permease [Rhodobacteraceae bacterium]|nr:carbohydrate ABC transporter permease [Paracoccaceae bacterium]MCY4250953.1 carbohydrate ABC transporter permease [Paracoccaceae bacterium]